MITQDIQSLDLKNPLVKEKLFEALENDRDLFIETLEIILNLIISDPKLTYDVADLIEAEYKNLYMVIAKKVTNEGKTSELPGCCKDL